jgi:Helix-turn-helix domain
MALDFEPFVDAGTVAQFLGITPRRVIEMARKGELPAHPFGRGRRHTWRFRISKIAACMDARKPEGSDMLDLGSPRRHKEKSA